MDLPPRIDNICPGCDLVLTSRAPDGTWSIRTRARGLVLDQSRLDDPASQQWVTLTDPEGDIGAVVVCPRCRGEWEHDDDAIKQALGKANKRGDRRVRVPLRPVL